MGLRGERDRLEGELADLRGQYQQTQAALESLEASLWWRANPRRLLRTLAGRRRPAQSRVTPRDSGTATEPRSRDDLVDRFRTEVMARGSFSVDWLTDRVGQWETFLPEFEHRPTRALEIGSYEGLATCFLLWRLPLSAVTCIDTFAGSIEHERTAELEALELRFESNVSLFDQVRIRKIKGDSKSVLPDLLEEDTLFDLVYVDGSHRALDVIVDAALSWQLLERGGVLVFDDYNWNRFTEPLLRPAPAIDAFTTLAGEAAEVLFSGFQVGLRRLA